MSKYHSNVHPTTNTPINSNWDKFRAKTGPSNKKRGRDFPGKDGKPKAKKPRLEQIMKAEKLLASPPKQGQTEVKQVDSKPQSFTFGAPVKEEGHAGRPIQEEEGKKTMKEEKKPLKEEKLKPMNLSDDEDLMVVDEAEVEKDIELPDAAEESAAAPEAAAPKTQKSKKQNETERILKAAKLRGNLKWYNTLIAENAKRKHTKVAIALFQQLKEQNLKPTVFTYSTVINACVRGGEVDRAKEFLTEMQEAGIQPNEVTWTTMIKGYTDVLFNTKKAMKLIDEMKAAGVKPNIRTYNTFLRGCLRTGDIKNAKVIFGEMSQAKKLEKKDEKKEKKEDKEEEGKEEKKDSDSIAPDQYTIDSYAKILALFGERDQAEWQLYELEKLTNEVHPTVYLQLASAFALAGEFGKAAKMLKKLKGRELLDSFKEDVERIQKFVDAKTPLDDNFGTGPKNCKRVLSLPKTKKSNSGANYKFNMKQSLLESAEVNWSELDWENPSQKVKMEVCTGMGSWIIDQCIKNPDVNWVALEQRYDRVHQIWSKMSLLGIRNLVVISGEANAVFKESMKSNSVDEIFINFPDPPLDFDNSRTLFVDEFIDNIRRVLKKKASVTVCTDDKKYSEFISAQFDKSKERHLKKALFKVDQSEAQIYEHSSFFDQLWQQRGRTERFFCSFQKKKLGPDCRPIDDESDDD